MITPGKVDILETTLRDGSYVIDFQFTAKDTETLSRALAKAGVQIIEIGHGIGINASSGKGKAAATDVEYVKAGKRGAPNAKIGMFCIPGIAELEHLRACAQAGMDFVRIGVNVDQVPLSKPFIEEAKRLGLFVCTNFMKSYAISPKEFAAVVKTSADYGSDLIYLVDSAGGMLPNEVKAYIAAMKEVTSLPLGFHGHNNIGMAVANSLAAVEAGASLVDTTLLGMGRSSGNAPTEVIVPLLQRCFGACTGIQALHTLEMAEKLISPMVKNRWENTEKTALGLAQVHSMYIDKIRKASRAERRMLFSVILEVGALDKINLEPKVLDAALAKSLPEDSLAQFLGPVALVEELADSSSIEEIARVAVKLNLPVLLDTRTGMRRRKVGVTAAAVTVACDAKEALQFMRHPASFRRQLILDQELASNENLAIKILETISE